MGLDLGAYVKVSEKRYDFVPDMQDIRASQTVRFILNKVLGVDFSKAEPGYYTWENESLTDACTKLQEAAADMIVDHKVDFIEYKTIFDFFRECLAKGYVISLV